MDKASQARRNAEARAKINAALSRFRGGEAALHVMPSRYPELHRLLELEAIADFVTGLADEYVPAKKETKAEKAQKELDAQGVQESIHIAPPESELQNATSSTAQYDDDPAHEDVEADKKFTKLPVVKKAPAKGK